jgi:6-pyruvoyl-tetrahydropterin synthase
MTITLTAKQSENGMVMNTSTIEKKVKRCAQIPGPSSHAEKTKFKRYFVSFISSFILPTWKWSSLKLMVSYYSSNFDITYPNLTLNRV